MTSTAPVPEAAFAPFACCTECDYSRAGLALDVPCPECGAAAPDSSWLFVRGFSRPGLPIVAILFGVAALIAFASIPVVITSLFGMRQPILIFVIVIQTFSASLFALLAIVNGVRRLRVADRGGDLLWIVKRSTIEIRDGLHRVEFGVNQLTGAHLESSMFRGWHGIALTPARLRTAAFATRVLWLEQPRDRVAALTDAIRLRVTSK